MRTFKRALGAALAFAVVLFQQSCENSYGIFQEVQKERVQKGEGIFKKKSVTSIVSYGGYFYAATARIYRRAASGSDWDIWSIPGVSYDSLYGLAATSGGVYASTDQGVYNVVTGLELASAPASSEALYTANDELFLTTHVVNSSSNPVTSSYALYWLNGAIFEAVQNFAPATDESIRGVAHDGTSYYFAAEDHLFRSANANGAGATSVTFTKTIWSASTAASGAYIGTTDGYLYRYQGGTEESKEVTSVPISSVVEAPLAAGTWRLLVGTGTTSASTNPKGYLESNEIAATALDSTTFTAGEDGDVASSSSVYSTTVANLPVNAFAYDGGTGTLLIGLSSYTGTGVHYGLYSSSWSGGSWSGWEAE